MINPLHLPVRSYQYSNYSTLSGALIFPSSSIKRLPQPPYSPSCKFHNAINRRSPLQPPITFDSVSQSSSTHEHGVKMQHLATRDCTHTIIGGNDRILINNGQQRITFRILWPGYSEEWARSIEVMSPRPITRARLGHIIAQNFLRFMETNRSTPCGSPEWSLCSGKIRFENLILVSLVNTFKDSWQADVLVDLR